MNTFLVFDGKIDSGITCGGKHSKVKEHIDILFEHWKYKKLLPFDWEIRVYLRNFVLRRRIREDMIMKVRSMRGDRFALWALGVERRGQGQGD